MRHVFFGEYELTIDDKNRLLVPSEVRRQVDAERDGEAFFAIMGVNRKLWLYPEKFYQEMVTRDLSDVSPGEELLAFDQMNFAMAAKMEWDKQGRILLPEKTLKRINLGKDVTLIGVRDHLELWTTPDWEVRREELMSQSAEITLKAKQARKGVAG